MVWVTHYVGASGVPHRYLVVFVVIKNTLDIAVVLSVF